MPQICSTLTLMSASCMAWSLWFWKDEPLPSPAPECEAGPCGRATWWLERRFRQAHDCIVSPEVVVRTSLQKRVGGYDPRLPHTGDIEMWMRLAANADVGYLRGVDQAYYRVHGQNMRIRPITPLMDLRQQRLAYEVVLERCDEQVVRRRPHLSDLVHRKLAWAGSRGRPHVRTTRAAPSRLLVDELVAFRL